MQTKYRVEKDNELGFLLCVVTQPMNLTTLICGLSARLFPNSISFIRAFLPSSPAVATTEVMRANSVSFGT